MKFDGWEWSWIGASKCDFMRYNKSGDIIMDVYVFLFSSCLTKLQLIKPSLTCMETHDHTEQSILDCVRLRNLSIYSVIELLDLWCHLTTLVWCDWTSDIRLVNYTTCSSKACTDYFFCVKSMHKFIPSILILGK